MNRKNFIRITLPAVVGASLIGTSACTSPKKKSKTSSSSDSLFFKLSLAQWSIHNMIWEKKISAFDFASLAHKWGFEGLEYVAILYRDNLETPMTSAQIQNMITRSNAQAQEHGMKNLIIMVDGEGDLCVEDAVARKAAIDNHKKWVDAAAEMGCHSIRLNLFGVSNPTQWADYASDSMYMLGEYAKASNVNILIENHGHLSSDAQLVMQVLERVDLPNCGTLPDFGNFCLEREGGARWGAACIKEYDMYQGVQELMPRAKAVSAKSYAFDADGNETKIDYTKMLSIVRDAGYSGYIGVEYEGSESEEEGIMATKNLLMKAGKSLS